MDFLEARLKGHSAWAYSLGMCVRTLLLVEFFGSQQAVGNAAPRAVSTERFFREDQNNR